MNIVNGELNSVWLIFKNQVNNIISLYFIYYRKIMKQSEIDKIPKLIEKVEDSEFKFNRIQSLIKQICSPNSPGWDQASGTLK